MVALAVRFCGQIPVKCGARPLLHKAYAALERRDYIAAGCLLREGVRLFLLAECEYHDCLPKRAERQSPMKLARALRAKGELSESGFDWIGEIIEVGNKLAHLVFVRPSLVECCISCAHEWLDGSPYLVDALREGGAV